MKLRRWNQEERIHGLLDGRRKIITRVRFITAVIVLGGFALFSTFVAGTRVGAQNSADASEPKWGEAKDGLRTRLVAGKQTYDAGEPIPMTLEIENTSEKARDFRIAATSNNESLFDVVDERGRKVPYLGLLYQLQERSEKLAPGERRQLQSFDLADSYYLRRAGHYVVRFTKEPASAAFEFEVAANPALASADGDPIGLLLPLVKEGWWLGAGQPGKRQPGRNWAEVKGRTVTFVYNPPSFKNDAGHVWLVLADEPAAALPPNSFSSMPESESLGKIGRWHVYFLISENASKAWPTAKQDIRNALAQAPQPQPKLSIKIEYDRAVFKAGDSVMVKIYNHGPIDIEAPATYWSARVVLDGKRYARLPKFNTRWNGAGKIIPKGVYASGFELSEYGIGEAALAAGDHKLSVNIGDEKSNELTLSIGTNKPKSLLK